MGAWGVNSFENDAALAYWSEIEERPTHAEIIDHLDSTILVDSEENFIRHETSGIRLIAAAEVMAALINDSDFYLPTDGFEWFSKHRDIDVSFLFHYAQTGLNKVLRDESGLNKLYKENQKSHPLWRESVEHLYNRLHFFKKNRNFGEEIENR